MGKPDCEVELHTLDSREPAEPFKQPVARSGLHWWLSGGGFNHREAETERLVVRIFIKVQANDDDRPELIAQIGTSFSR